MLQQLKNIYGAEIGNQLRASAEDTALRSISAAVADRSMLGAAQGYGKAENTAEEWRSLAELIEHRES